LDAQPFRIDSSLPRRKREGGKAPSKPPFHEAELGARALGAERPPGIPRGAGGGKRGRPVGSAPLAPRGDGSVLAGPPRSGWNGARRAQGPLDLCREGGLP